MNLLHRLWQDEQGFIVSTELILMGTIATLGLVVGLATYRDSVVQELGDTAMGIGVLNQSYDYETDLDPSTNAVDSTRTFDFGHIDSGGGACEPFVSVSVTTFDSSFTDQNDFCDNTQAGLEGTNVADPAGGAPACLIMNTSPQEEGN
jgi:hypothetical protein